MLFTFGVVGALDFGHKTQSGIKGGWGCEHWKIKARSVMEHGHKPITRTKTRKHKKQWNVGIN
jgi:hypothetical protein